MRVTRASIAALIVFLPLTMSVGEASIIDGEQPATVAPATEPGHLSSPFWFTPGQPVWFRDGAWTADAQTAVRAMGDAGIHGLSVQDYQLSNLNAAMQTAAGGDPRAVAVADALLSASVVHFVNDLYNGRIDPRTVGWKAETGSRRAETMLSDALRAGTVQALLSGPASPAYRGLLRVRAEYQRLAGIPWPRISDGPTIDLGEESARVATLREQLTILGDFVPPAVPTARLRKPDRDARKGGPVILVSSDAGTAGDWSQVSREGRASAARFDGSVASALKRFQERHGLAQDGRVGPATRTALNVSPAERLRQVDATLERLRWLPEMPESRYIIVNIPAFELTAYDHGSPALRMPVVVGEPDWQTPILSDEVVNLKFAPTWTIPPKIVKQETLAQIRRDPGYLERKNIRIYRAGAQVSPWELDWESSSAGVGYTFRQEPGADNALGQIRFSLTNPYDIYLHDTPSTRGFKQSSRALSHGCIRVAEPEQLALFVLNDASWDRARVETAMNAPKTHYRVLPQPVPVHLLYMTSWVNDAGQPQFRADVYGQDAKLLSAVEHRPRWSPPAVPVATSLGG